jgi:hypothetical protein
MSYHEVCGAIMQVFTLSQPGIPEMCIDTLRARWTNPATGLKDRREVFGHNWEGEIVPFLTQHPAAELELGFGVALVEKFVEEDEDA